MVTLVVTVKDTCGQAQYILDRLAKTYPKDMALIYAYPDIRGCRSVPVSPRSSLNPSRCLPLMCSPVLTPC